MHLPTVQVVILRGESLKTDPHPRKDRRALVRLRSVKTPMPLDFMLWYETTG